MQKSMKWLLLFAAVFAAEAQVTEQIQRATMKESRGSSGKCTIEVRVDITAEVDIYGDSGRLRTLAGQPATWTRMECSDPLPYQMSDFRFRGIDGRGNVRLVQDPRNNHGMAVVRIDDPKSGAEGYTFDIEWSGASSGFPTGGFSRGNGYPGDPGGFRPGRGARGNLSAERAIDLCRTEVRERSEREYGLRDIDITAAALDTNRERRDWVTGTFNTRSGNFRRTAQYRFNCAVDYGSGQVRTVEILRADGSMLQPGRASGNPNQGAPYNRGGYDQTKALRACQDAVVARTNRDGYQNVTFGPTTGFDSRRSDRIVGTITANRGPVTDTFDFACSMDLRGARVLNMDFSRRP